MKKEFEWQAEMWYIDLVVRNLIDTSDFSYCIYKISC